MGRVSRIITTYHAHHTPEQCISPQVLDASPFFGGSVTVKNAQIVLNQAITDRPLFPHSSSYSLTPSLCFSSLISPCNLNMSSCILCTCP